MAKDDRILLRVLSRLNYQDPEPYLRRMHKLRSAPWFASLPRDLRNLRTPGLKRARETWEGAIFCYGMGQRIGTTVGLSPLEDQDFDIAACWNADGETNFATVQLKEVVPPYNNPSMSVQKVIDKLPTKYPVSSNLVVAIHHTKADRLDLDELRIPKLRIGGLWVFGAISPDLTEWGLWGDLLQTAEGIRFTYPT